MEHSQKLAIDGGEPLVKTPLPAGVSGPSTVGDDEITAIADVLRDQNLFRYLGDDGSEVDKFEREAAQFLGVGYTLMVNSGTSALICALTGVGVGSGDEVIVPAYTYVATPTAVVAAGAVPVIAEIDESLGLDPADVEKKIAVATDRLDEDVDTFLQRLELVIRFPGPLSADRHTGFPGAIRLKLADPLLGC